MLLQKWKLSLVGMFVLGTQSNNAVGSVTEARVALKQAQVKILENIGCQHFDDELIGDACAYRVQVEKSKHGLAGELTLYHKNRADAFEAVFADESTLTLSLRQIDESGATLSAQDMFVEKILSLDSGEFQGGVNHIIAKVKSKRSCKLIAPDAAISECRYRMQNLKVGGDVPKRFELVYFHDTARTPSQGQLNLSSQATYHLVTQNRQAPYGAHHQLLVEAWLTSEEEAAQSKDCEQKQCPSLPR